MHQYLVKSFVVRMVSNVSLHVCHQNNRINLVQSVKFTSTLTLSKSRVLTHIKLRLVFLQAVAHVVFVLKFLPYDDHGLI